MNHLGNIPVTVIHTDESGSPSSQVHALLQELDTMLHKLIHKNETGSIDIRSLPLLPGDYEYLKQVLGEGEVTAMLESLGPSTVIETAVPGIWWITHRNAHDEILAEFIEVTTIPTILGVTEEDRQQARSVLQARITQYRE